MVKISPEALERTRDVARAIQAKGYGLTDVFGYELHSSEEINLGAVGILDYKTDQEKLPGFLGLWNKIIPSRNLVLGVLHIDNGLGGIEYNKHWVFDVYGVENSRRATRIVENLSDKYGVTSNIVVYPDLFYEKNSNPPGKLASLESSIRRCLKSLRGFKPV